MCAMSRALFTALYVHKRKQMLKIQECQSRAGVGLIRNLLSSVLDRPECSPTHLSERTVVSQCYHQDRGGAGEYSGSVLEIQDML